VCGGSIFAHFHALAALPWTKHFENDLLPPPLPLGACAKEDFGIRVQVELFKYCISCEPPFDIPTDSAIQRFNDPPNHRGSDPQNVHVTVAAAMAPKVTVSFSFADVLTDPQPPTTRPPTRTPTYLHIELFVGPNQQS